MTLASSDQAVQISVPQKYKDFVVRRQYRWFWFILAGVLGGINAVYYILCVVFHWKWQFHFQSDIILPIMGLITYALEVRKPWHYKVDEHSIKLFVTNPTFRLASLKEINWIKTEIAGVETDEWQGLPCLKLKVLPASSYTYLMVYSHTDDEEIKIKALPLIEKYRHQYRQELWTDKLRS